MKPKVSTHSTLLLALILGLLALPASALTGRAIFLGSGSGAPQSAVLVAADKQIEIKLPRRNLSPEFDLPNGISSFAVTSAPLPKGQKVHPKAPKGKIPDQTTRILLLFLTDPKNQYFPAKVTVIDASAGKFPAGHSMLYNLTKSRVAGKFGSSSVVVARYRSAMIKPPKSSRSGYPVIISWRTAKDKNRWTVLCSSTWMHNPRARQLIFVVPVPRRTSPRVWSVFDHPQEKKMPDPS